MFVAPNVTIIFRSSDVDTFLNWPFRLFFVCFEQAKNGWLFDNENFIATNVKRIAQIRTHVKVNLMN